MINQETRQKNDAFGMHYEISRTKGKKGRKKSLNHLKKMNVIKEHFSYIFSNRVFTKRHQNVQKMF